MREIIQVHLVRDTDWGAGDGAKLPLYHICSNPATPSGSIVHLCILLLPIIHNHPMETRTLPAT